VSTGASRAALLLSGALIAALVALVLIVTGVISVTGGGEDESAASRGTLTPIEVFEQCAAGVVEVRATFAQPGVAGGGSGLGLEHGLLVVQVTPGSPAAKADIRGGTDQVLLQGQPFVMGGDVITAVDGHAIASTEDLAAQIVQREPGETVAVDLVRGTQRLSVEVTLAARGT
jgi:S1-C subfamily serine protease